MRVFGDLPVIILYLAHLSNALPSTSKLLARADNTTTEDGQETDDLDLSNALSINIFTNPPPFPDTGNIIDEKPTNSSPLVPGVALSADTSNTEKRAEIDTEIIYHVSDGNVQTARTNVTWFPDPAPTDMLLAFFTHVGDVASQSWADKSNSTGEDGARQWYLIMQNDLSFFIVVDTSVMQEHGKTFCWGDIATLAKFLHDDSQNDGRPRYGWSFHVKGKADGIIFADGHVGFSFVPDQAYIPSAGKRSFDSGIESQLKPVLHEKRMETVRTLEKRVMNLGLQTPGWDATFRNQRGSKISQQFLFYLLSHAMNQLNEGLPTGREVNHFIAQLPQFANMGIQNAANYAFQVAGSDPTMSVPLEVIKETLTYVLSYATTVGWNQGDKEVYTLQGSIRNSDGVTASWVLGPKLSVGWQKEVVFVNPDGSLAYGAFVHHT